MSEQDANTIRAKSWRDSNSTLEHLIKWLSLAGVLVYAMHFADSRIEKHKELLSSGKVVGCVLSPRLMADVPPPVPAPIPDSELLGDWMVYYNQRLSELHRTIQDANNDKAEIRALCQ